MADQHGKLLDPAADLDLVARLAGVSRRTVGQVLNALELARFANCIPKPSTGYPQEVHRETV